MSIYASIYINTIDTPAVYTIIIIIIVCNNTYLINERNKELKWRWIWRWREKNERRKICKLVNQLTLLTYMFVYFGDNKIKQGAHVFLIAVVVVVAVVLFINSRKITSGFFIDHGHHHH